MLEIKKKIWPRWNKQNFKINNCFLFFFLFLTRIFTPLDGKFWQYHSQNFWYQYFHLLKYNLCHHHCYYWENMLIVSRWTNTLNDFISCTWNIDFFVISTTSFLTINKTYDRLFWTISNKMNRQNWNIFTYITYVCSFCMHIIQYAKFK